MNPDILAPYYSTYTCSGNNLRKKSLNPSTCTFVLLEYSRHDSKGFYILYEIIFHQQEHIMAMFDVRKWYLPCLVGVCSSCSLCALCSVLLTIFCLYVCACIVFICYICLNGVAFSMFISEILHNYYVYSSVNACVRTHALYHIHMTCVCDVAPFITGSNSPKDNM